MGESMVDFPNSEDKITLSVSFGRFENDSLSWEKWSSFSSNKYLEEVEKCATPGSVAEKKAYFEARHKKIAARKLVDQGNEMDNNYPRTDYQHDGDLMGNNCGTDRDSAEVIAKESILTSETGNNHVDDCKGDSAVATMGCQELLVEEVKEELTGRLDSSMFNDSAAEACSMEEKSIPSIEPQMKVEIKQKLASVENTSKLKDKKVRLNHHKETHKEIATINKQKNVAGKKKKPALPTSKSPRISNSKVSKQVPTAAIPPASRASTKKIFSSPLLRSKTPSVVEGKRAVPKSLDMSLALGHVDYGTAAPTTTGKSAIMEKLGDKNIVKQAFKTFQNNIDPVKSSVGERSSIRKQMPSKGTELRGATATSRRENGGSLKPVRAVHGSPKPNPSSFAVKSDERAEKQKGKLVGKSNAKEASRTHLQPKSKEQSGVDGEKLKRNVNIRATPLPGFYGGQKGSKAPIEKDSSKNVIHR